MQKKKPAKVGMLYRLDMAVLPTYEMSAMAIAILAYPEHDAPERVVASDSLCAWAIKALAEHDPNWARSYQPIKPCYVAVTDAVRSAQIKNLKNILMRRAAAGRMALMWLKEAATGTVENIPMLNGRSLSDVAGYVGKDAREFDSKNVGERVWRPATQVMHLAAALQILVQDHKRAGSELTFEALVFDKDCLMQWLGQAEQLEKVMQKTPALQKHEPALHRIRLLNQPQL